MELTLCTGGHYHAETGKGLSQTATTKLRMPCKISLYTVRVPFTSAKELSPNYEKTDKYKQILRKQTGQTVVLVCLGRLINLHYVYLLLCEYCTSIKASLSGGS